VDHWSGKPGDPKILAKNDFVCRFDVAQDRVHGKFSLTDLAGSERGADVQVLSLDATNNPCDRDGPYGLTRCGQSAVRARTRQRDR
jgi:hypothetical protein